MILRANILSTLFAISWLICFAALINQTKVFASTSDTQNTNLSYEHEVLAILEVVKAGDIGLALTLVDKHLSKYPTSRIAHLIRADLLTAMSSGVNEVGQGLSKSSVAVNDLIDQIKNRWQQAETQKLNNQLLPSNLIEVGQHKHVIVADLNSGRLYLYENINGQATLLRDYYLTVGSEGFGKEVEGDNKTPVGVYSINQHIPAEELADLYGDGAYPVNYPNEYDRGLNRTGNGIWLHGTPSNTYSRAPWASRGCFVLSNEDLIDIEKHISVKERTPVILSDNIDWISRSDLTVQRALYLSVIEQWQNDWESLDTEAYLSHYSQANFNFGKSSFESWAISKREVNLSKTSIKINLEIKGLFAYPGVKDMFVVQYKQDYQSNNFSSKTNKQQYWQLDKQARWKIIYED